MVTWGAGASCKPDSSPCWTLFRTFLGSEGAAQMAADGATLWANRAKELELEQSTVRIAVCAALLGVEQNDAERVAATDACPELQTAVRAAAKAELAGARVDGEVQCSSFGLGPGSACSADSAPAESSEPASGTVEGDDNAPSAESGAPGPSDTDRDSDDSASNCAQLGAALVAAVSLATAL